MDILTNEEALLSVSRSAAFDDSAAPQVGAHGSYSSSIHVPTLPPIWVLKIWVLKNNKRGPAALQATRVAHSSGPSHHS
jgi:hypothetical protein